MASLLCHSVSLAIQPTVYWSAEPVMPGEMAMLQGTGWNDGVRVSFTRGSRSFRAAAASSGTGTEAIYFEVPDDLPIGVTPFTLSTREGELACRLNLPLVWWLQGDGGSRASPGGWIRAFGRCLSFDGTAPQLVLRRDGTTVPTAIHDHTAWSITARLPGAVEAGTYEVWVHNGTGDDSAWERADSIEIDESSTPWRNRIIDIRQFGAVADDEVDDSAAFTRALQAATMARGAIVRFPRGQYRMTGSFTIPPRVLIQGAGMDLTQLIWKDTEAPPEALLENTEGGFGIEDLGLFANDYVKGLSVHPPQPRSGSDNAVPTDIRLQRLLLRFNPLVLQTSTPTVEAHQAPAPKRNVAVVDIHGDNVRLINCDLAWGTSVGFTLQGNHVVCRNNVAHAEGGGWCPVGGGRRIICENNVFTGATTGVTRGAEVWFAHNKVTHQYRNDREGFTTDGPFGGVGFLVNPTVQGRKITFSARHPRDEKQTIPAAVRIVAGTGAGQVRLLRRLEGNSLEMEHEFDIAPDETSLLWAANALHHHIIFDNDMSDTGIAVQLFGAALDCVIVGNKSLRSGGFRAWGNEMCDRVQFLENVITAGYGTVGREMLAGRSSINIDGPWVYGYKGITTRGIVVRRNAIRNNASVLLHGGIQDVLIENNVIEHSPRGIVSEGTARQQGVILKGNRFSDVDTLIEPPEAARAYTVIESKR